MKGTLRRVGTVLSVFALTLAGAVPPSAAEPAPPVDSRDAAVVVRTTHDLIQAAADAGDVEMTRSAVADLGSLLAELDDGERYALRPSSRQLAGAAAVETATTQQRIDELFPPASTGAEVPPAQQLEDAVQRLLLSLSALVNDLLGGSPPLPGRNA